MAWLLLPHLDGRKTSATSDPGGPNAMLLTTLITVLFVGVSSAVLWFWIGAD